jgi:hypothetical protein
MSTCAQPHERPTQQISVSLRLTEESSRLSHHLNSLHRGDQYIVSSPSQRERHTQLMGFLTPHRGTQRSISVSERNHTPISWASSPHTGGHNVPSPSQRETTHPTHGHTQLMGSLSRQLTQSVSWRMSHAAIIINTPSQLGRHSPQGQVSHGSTRTLSWL